MGNKLGGQKSTKAKDEKKREKEVTAKREKEEEKLKKKTTKKEKKESKSKKKEKAKKADSKSKHPSGRSGGHNFDSEPDTDRESSHVTGWDSESGVFHSAENISTSPYLDSHTRSELEHSGTWSALYESSASRHPQVLSSRDFRDGFSLEACIPPEIARRDTNFYDQDGLNGSGGGSGSGGGGNVFSYSNSGSLRSKRSNSTKSSRMTPISARYHADDLMSVSTSSSQKSGALCREGYSTPLLTTPVFGRADRSYSPTAPCGASSTLTRVHEADNDSMDIESLPKSPFDPNAKVYTTYNPPAHLAHIYQHPSQSIDYRNLPKPTSPHPQRRALSPKMTSPHFKLISSDDSSSSPTTPIPQRKNILAELLRTGRGSSEKKKQQKAKTVTSESDENGAYTHSFSTKLAEAGERKKSKGLSMWKTWERSSKKKSDKPSKISIFGTSRKTNKKSEKRDRNETPQDEDKFSKESKTTDRMSDSTLKDEYIGTNIDTIPDRTDKPMNKAYLRPAKTAKSSTSSYDTSDVDYWGDKNRNSSPPVAKTAASCIMRLEELERNIEKTIREKFPDAEPFLIRKRTPPDDSSRGSKSLPTTPSPKKKMFITHDATNSAQKEAVTSTLKAASSKLGAVVKGTTRYYDETFEASASPVMSPVVLRRFGARTRHASISPKIQRTKTAALYNSPSEMERVSECLTPLSLNSPPNEPTNQLHRTPMSKVGHSKSTPSSQPSQSHGHHLVRQRRIELSESDEDISQNRRPWLQDLDTQSTRIGAGEKGKENSAVDTYSFDKPVIVPSFSAVFGSVSPKLKRHLQSKLDGQGSNRVARSFDHSNIETQHNGNRGDTRGTGVSLGKRSESLDTTLKNSKGDKARECIVGQPIEQERDNQKTCAQRPSNISATNNSSRKTGNSSPSVQTRVAHIMKTMSEGWAGSGEGSGGYPFPSHAHNSEKMRSGTATVTSASPPCSTPACPNSSSHLRCADTMQHGEAKVGTKESLMTSPGTGRKHSTDHVIFGSAVALPCRLYSNSSSPPSSPERRKGTNNNTFSMSHFDSTSSAHAQTDARGVHERNVKRCEGQVDVSANTPSTQSAHIESSCKESTTLLDRLVENNRDVIKDNVPISGENSGDSKSKAHAINSRRSKNTKGVYHSDVVSHSDVSGDNSKLSQPNSSRDKCRAGHEEIQTRPSLGPEVGLCGEKVLEEEQPVIVLKQPVSKVISDMINSSKQREQQRHLHEQEQQQQQQQQQQRNWQASPTTPEKDAMHVEPAIAMVTTPSFQQACLSLEEKSVVDGSRSVPSSRSVANSNKGESYKETGENGVKAHSDEKERPCTQVKATGAKSAGVGAGTSSETSEGSDIDRFIKSVKASEKISSNSKTTIATSDQNDIDQNPPPPSPTAVDKVSEILEEEEEEEEDEDISEEAIRQDNQPMVNLALVRHNEMRVFSDEVCQRLSDLLSSHTGSDDVFVGTDWKDEDDKDTEEEEEMSMTNVDTEENVPGYRDDLHEHWEDPGLLSEPSEDPTGETMAHGKSLIENPPISELRRSRFSTSSSLSTSLSSSSSSSGLFAPPSLPPSGKRTVEGAPKSKISHEYFTYRKQEDDDAFFDEQAQNRQDAHTRTYHSDDDVARGGAIPDYYDDRPLWKKRQKPPGQISIAMAAIRRRERRERWLKKRRRNRTDLLSTGSSDMGSDASLKQVSRLSFGDSTGSCEYEEEEEIASALTSHHRAMGSGILCSPKYSKPIMPFWGSGDIAPKTQKEAKEDVITAERVEPRLTAPRQHGGGSVDDDDDDDLDDSCDKDSSTISRSTDHTLCEEHSQSFDTMDELDDHRASLSTTTSTTEVSASTATACSTGSHSHIAIPGLEETFDELMSVKQILEELQDRTPTTGACASKAESSRQPSDNGSNNNRNSSSKCMPLTVENIKSIKELYKDSSGRRSRMSNTDRTESDLDLFSEYRDDASTDSNLYADDEDDDDNNEPYATADDDVTGATGADEDEDFVVSCTFYNSKAAPSDYVNGNSRQKSFENNENVPTGVTPSELTSETSNDNHNNNNATTITATTITATTTTNTNNTNNDNNNGEGIQNLLVRPHGAGYVRSNSAPGSRSESGNQFSLSREAASAAGFNSDEEFWAGRAAFERSYQQLESAAGAVSSTFQNAREQMMDIQQHLQALRRQMEGLQDDLTSTSYTLTPDFSAFDSK